MAVKICLCFTVHLRKSPTLFHLPPIRGCKRSQLRFFSDFAMPSKQVFYRGYVQGVGFRYTVKRIAGGYEVTGWVRNLPDGRVELQATTQDAQELDAFLEDIRTSALGGNIKDVQIHDIPSPAPVKGFIIVE